MKRPVSALAVAALVLSACSTAPTTPPQPAPPVPPPVAPPQPPPTASIASLYRQPAERSLVDGIRLYEEASFRPAEAALRRALGEGLADRRDRATAFKYLAFITCAFDRVAECEASFAAAFDADPAFTLGESEVGHPLWGPVYARIAAQRRQ